RPFFFLHHLAAIAHSSSSRGLGDVYKRQFMRRTFKGNPLYSAVFNEYLHTLFTKGFPVEYFVEGLSLIHI
ncbi:hypothetical protein QN398_28020, partial [Pseudomonas sp. CCC2.2]